MRWLAGGSASVAFLGRKGAKERQGAKEIPAFFLCVFANLRAFASKNPWRLATPPTTGSLPA